MRLRVAWKWHASASHEASRKDAPVPRPDGQVLPGSIAEVAYRRLGGLDQWVLIRGESIANPPLILLHGGPGLSETRFFRRFNAPLGKSFTVVYWDQDEPPKFNAAMVELSSRSFTATRPQIWA